MSSGYFALQWPRDLISANVFVHELANFRYHWHNEDYEMNILLHGKQDFCFGRDRIILQENDVLLIPPGVGHASFAQKPNTRALVLHFSASSLRPLVKQGTALQFRLRPDNDSISSVFLKELRFHASKFYASACSGTAVSRLAAKGSLLCLISSLYEHCSYEEVRLQQEVNPQQEMIAGLLSFVDANYAAPLTLQDLADYTSYNRTYISTLFKDCTGTGFHEYLTRVRFQHALLDLASSPDKLLTDIALSNGFPDLKSLNKCMRELLGRSASEYRAELDSCSGIPSLRSESRLYVSPEDPIVTEKIAQYTKL